MHFKGEYWIIENMCLKIWYMSLKPAIDIHNIMYTGYVHVNPISPFASITQNKKRVWIVDPWHVQQVEPQTLIMEKILVEKLVNLP